MSRKAWRSSEMLGSAVFTTVRSRNTIRVPIDMIARISQRRGSPSSVGWVSVRDSVVLTVVVLVFVCRGSGVRVFDDF